MELEEHKPAVTVIALIILAVLLYSLYLYRTKTGTPSIGDEVFDRIQNPVSGEVPQTNPFQDKKTNPFEEEGSVNPFSNSNANPFR